MKKVIESSPRASLVWRDTWPTYGSLRVTQLVHVSVGAHYKIMEPLPPFWFYPEELIRAGAGYEEVRAQLVDRGAAPA